MKWPKIVTQPYNVCLFSFLFGEKPKILQFARFFLKTILDKDIMTETVLLVPVWIPQLQTPISLYFLAKATL